MTDLDLLYVILACAVALVCLPGGRGRRVGRCPSWRLTVRTGAWYLCLHFSVNPKVNTLKTSEAIQAFGGVKKLADALGIWPHPIYRWGEDVPELRAYQIREILEKRASEGGVE